jgi:predicted nucleotidyltransferase component of viral defense system
MLHLNTIDAATHKVLLSLLSKDYLSSFSLVGGTSLSLRFGHRKSIDLDLFSVNEFEPGKIDELLKYDYPDYVYKGNNKNMLFADIAGVKTDIIRHPFELLKPVEVIDSIRMFSVEDVAAMKQFAVCKRGTRKDMYDIWVLLQHFSAKELAGFFVQKYGEDKLIFFQKSILYFEDADQSVQPEVLIKGLTWEKVKKSVYEAFVDL